jgi:hypothetical protein
MLWVLSSLHQRCYAQRAAGPKKIV